MVSRTLLRTAFEASQAVPRRRLPIITRRHPWISSGDCNFEVRTGISRTSDWMVYPHHGQLPPTGVVHGNGGEPENSGRVSERREEPMQTRIGQSSGAGSVTRRGQSGNPPLVSRGSVWERAGQWASMPWRMGNLRGHGFPTQIGWGSRARVRRRIR